MGRLLTAVLAASVVVVWSTTAAADADEIRMDVSAEGPPGAVLEEHTDDWRFLCRLPCETSILRSAEHRIVDNGRVRSIRVPATSAPTVPRADRLKMGNILLISGGVVGTAGAGSLLAGFVVSWIRFSHDVFDLHHADRTTENGLLIAGSVGMLVGVAIVVGGLVARSSARAPSSASRPFTIEF